MNERKKIPLFQIIYFSILFLLIIFRFIFNNLSLYVNIANYISMVVAVSTVFYSSIMNIEDNRRQNICKVILVLFILIFALIGFSILIRNIEIPAAINDIFTIIALMFCISQKVCEYILLKIMLIGVDL